MNSSLEREVKLEARERFSLARLESRLGGFTASPVELHRLHTIYYDTDDLRLTRWGCSLRLRLPDTWTLKLPMPAAAQELAREEHVVKREGRAVPPELLELATSYLRGLLPHPVAELRTLRATRQVRSEAGDDLAEVAEDDVRVVEGTLVVKRFRQVEIELQDGAPGKALEDLTALLQSKGAGSLNATPKNLLALGPQAGEPEVVIPKLTAKSAVADIVRAAFAKSVCRLIRYDAKLRTAPDGDAVHDARVAVRRLRSDLRSFRLLLDRPWADALRNALAWLSDGLSAARDGDVLLERLRRDAFALPDRDRVRIEAALKPLRERRDTAYGHLEAMLREVRYIELLNDAVAAAQRPSFNSQAGRPAREMVAPIMREAWKSVRKAVRKLDDSSADRELHRVRIKAKRVRYAAEALEPVAGKPARRFAQKVENLQDVLGDQHDATVAEAALRKYVTGDDRFLAGELAALEIGRAAERRRTWSRSWRRIARKPARFW